MPPAFTTIPKTTPFSPSDAAAVLTLAKPGEVHVVTAAPGQGKSTKLREEIAARIKAGDLTQVLWAVQSIRGDDSLGKEALDHFGTLSVDAEIVFGLADLGHDQVLYNSQFTWPSKAIVKIVSHARLPMIFGDGSEVSTRFKDADLLVIDEDPSGSMLLASVNEPAAKGSRKPDRRLILAELAKSSNPVCVALAELADRVEAGTVYGVETFGPVKRFNKGHGLYGRALGSYLAALHPVDTTSLTAALSAGRLLSVETAQLVAQAIYEDAAVAAARPGSFERSRVGLHWRGSLPLAGPGSLRFNLRPPLTFHQPLILLDGYADAAYYASLFQGLAVTLHTFDPGPVLEVEYLKALHIDPAKNGKAVGRQRRIMVAEEIALQKKALVGRDQLVITSKALRDSGKEWFSLVGDAFTRHAPGLNRPSEMHWHAGRGLNTFSGFDVYALNPPTLSPMYAAYTLAGVILDDGRERARLAVHAQGSELLQMLNRGRQPDPSHGVHKPRIILATSEQEIADMLGPLIGKVKLRFFKPTLHFRKRNSRARWREMTAVLGEELLTHFPEGLPVALIGGLPKYVPKNKGEQRAEHLLSLLAARCGLGSELYAAFHDTASWLYGDVHPGGGSNNTMMLDEAMEDLGLSTEGVKPKVYLPGTPGANKQLALDRYMRFVTCGETACLPPVKGWP
ncbi:hypothetical protein [Deinococcus alpinitundrae]|uniref:hypothetical protein n=1 Tax=Deinococcus alpinitundrae TaxID=468913 RepID=UPI00137A4C90|nr:hypothetical protein [Deinococcus alpinitundrae]